MSRLVSLRLSQRCISALASRTSLADSWSTTVGFCLPNPAFPTRDYDVSFFLLFLSNGHCDTFGWTRDKRAPAQLLSLQSDAEKRTKLSPACTSVAAAVVPLHVIQMFGFCFKFFCRRHVFCHALQGIPEGKWIY